MSTTIRRSPVIAVPVKEKGDDPQLEERFGRSCFFCLIDNGGRKFFIENNAPASPSGAGVKTVQMLADEGVDTVLAPEVGPKATAAMEPLGIKVFNFGSAATLSEVLSLYEKGELEERKVPSAGGRIKESLIWILSY